MNIPNPENYLYISNLVSDNWIELHKFTQNSPFSKSSPSVGLDGNRAIYVQQDIALLPEFRARTRSKVRYILNTDVSKFYSSIYSHSVPWVIHGKASAKKNTRGNNLGNNFDKQIRNAQDGQTKGIPIGPDFSLLIAEMILTTVDNSFARAMPGINGFRFMDDYEFGFQSYTDAEAGLAILQHTLSEFELEVNFEKTAIRDLPVPLEDIWKSELLYFNFRDTAPKQRTDLIRYFSLAYSLAKQTPNKSVLKYAIRRIRGIKLDAANWPLLQDLLLQTIEVEVGALRAVLEMFVDWNSGEFDLNLGAIASVLDHTIEFGSKTGLDSEISWALWAMLNWKLNISEKAAQALSKVEDSLVALLALDANSRGLIPTGLDTRIWDAFANERELYGDQWLLAYEANIKGWLHNPAGDYVAADPFFGPLKAARVEFYNPDAPFRVVPPHYE
jgi:hypothetical protein